MAKLVFLNGVYAGKSFTIQPGKTITIGRNRELDLPLPDLKLSRRHCIVSSTEGRFFINDLESTNGTLVNGMRLDGGTELNAFDRITLGDTEIEFQCPEEKVSPVDSPAADAAPPANARGIAAAVNTPPPMKAAAAKLDPLEAALRELSQPLPPEPPVLNGAAEAAAAKPKLLFCSECEGSIPMLDWDLGVAKEIENKIYCRDCLAKGVNTNSAPASAPASAQGPIIFPGAPSSGTSSRETARMYPHREPEKPSTKAMDDILAGLDAEPLVIDTTPKKRGSSQASLTPPPKPAVQTPPPAPKPETHADPANKTAHSITVDDTDVDDSPEPVVDDLNLEGMD